MRYLEPYEVENEDLIELRSTSLSCLLLSNKIIIKINLNNIEIITYEGNKENNKALKYEFFNLRPFWRRRRQFEKIRRIWQKRKRLKKVKNSQGKEIHFMNYKMHKISTDIVQKIKSNIEKPVIILYNMKYIRDKMTNELKKMRKEKEKNFRKIRKLNWKINRWNFLQFQKMIEYKANWFGIPVLTT